MNPLAPIKPIQGVCNVCGAKARLIGECKVSGLVYGKCCSACMLHASQIIYNYMHSQGFIHPVEADMFPLASRKVER